MGRGGIWIPGNCPRQRHMKFPSFTQYTTHQHSCYRRTGFFTAIGGISICYMHYQTQPAKCSALILGDFVFRSLFSRCVAADPTFLTLMASSKTAIHPFLQNVYCISCHGNDKPEADFNLNTYASTASVVKDGRRGCGCPSTCARWVRCRLKRQTWTTQGHWPFSWFSQLHNYEIQHDAGDAGCSPGGYTILN